MDTAEFEQGNQDEGYKQEEQPEEGIVFTFRSKNGLWDIQLGDERGTSLRAVTKSRKLHNIGFKYMRTIIKRGPMGNLFSVKNREVHVNDQVFIVTKETADLLKRATYECHTKFTGWYRN